MSYKFEYYNHAYVLDPQECTVSEELSFKIIERDFVLKKNKSAFFASYITSFDVETPTDWWFTIKDNGYNLESLKSKRRYEIVKGKKFCTAKEINPLDYLDEIFCCYKASFEGYQDIYKPDVVEPEPWNSYLKRCAEDNSYFFYAVFYNETEELIGFGILKRKDTIVDLVQIKTNPYFEKFNSNLVLIDCILNKWNEELESKKVIISNGSRNIKHQTHFNEFLEKYFGFRKAYANLKIVYRFPFGVFINILKPFKKILAKSNNQFIYNIYSVLKMDKYQG